MLARFIVALTFCLIFYSMALGCVYTVRDVGFVDINSAPYQLCYYVKNDTPKDTINTFKQISYAVFTDTNVDAKIVNIDQKTDKQENSIKYVKLFGIKSFPTAVLISPKGLPMVLPAFSSKESFLSVLDGVVTSPKRDEILKHITKSHSVVLLVQGKFFIENNRAKMVVSESIKEIGKTMSQMPKSIEEPPYLITITPEMFSQEKILLWSLGINEKEINKPYVSILYGKGRQIGTLLDGDNITVNKVFNTLTIIGSSCECELDRKWVQGTLIPLRWGIKTQQDVAKYLAFDPESPVVKTEINQILSTDSSSDNIENEAIQNNKYSEKVVEYESNSRVLSPAQIQRLKSSDPISKNEPEAKTQTIIASQDKPDNQEKPK